MPHHAHTVGVIKRCWNNTIDFPCLHPEAQRYGFKACSCFVSFRLKVSQFSNCSKVVHWLLKTAPRKSTGLDIRPLLVANGDCEFRLGDCEIHVGRQTGDCEIHLLLQMYISLFSSKCCVCICVFIKNDISKFGKYGDQVRLFKIRKTYCLT